MTSNCSAKADRDSGADPRPSHLRNPGGAGGKRNSQLVFLNAMTRRLQIFVGFFHGDVDPIGFEIGTGFLRRQKIERAGCLGRLERHILRDIEIVQGRRCLGDQAGLCAWPGPRGPAASAPKAGISASAYFSVRSVSVIVLAAVAVIECRPQLLVAPERDATPRRSASSPIAIRSPSAGIALICTRKSRHELIP